MIIYLVSSSVDIEDVPSLRLRKHWGVLVSYKDVKTKIPGGSSRFKRLMKRKKYENIRIETSPGDNSSGASKPGNS